MNRGEVDIPAFSIRWPVLLFCRLADESRLDAVEHVGVQSDGTNEVRLYRTLEAAERGGSGPILVVDPTAFEDSIPSNGDVVSVPSVPAAALQNLDPFRPPRPAVAGGGFVGCPLEHDVALLIIHRRGVWDLPKGHRDPGEALESCALREVREEVGIDDLHLLRSLGTTQHGYPEDEVYTVKTTHWYLMRTSEHTFEPERREGIRRVTWARWSVARRHLGYENLRRHMDEVEETVRSTLE